MKKTRSISLGNLLFFIPVILLSYFMWNDYKDYMDEYVPSFERVYMLDEGKQLIGLAKHPVGEQYDVYLFNTQNETVIKDTTVYTDFSGGLGPVTYSHDGIIIPTYDDSSKMRVK